MAKLSLDVIQIIRDTAVEIQKSALYQWGHMGACNCGFLAQQVTQISKAEIHRRALQRHGDWNEQLNDYCPTSGLLFDDVISALLNAGFDIDDLKHLENLSDPLITRQIITPLSRNNKEHVVLYLKTWANWLEEELIKDNSIADVLPSEKILLPSVG